MLDFGYIFCAHSVRYYIRLLDKYFVPKPYVGKDVRNCGFEFKELEIFDKFEIFLKYGWFRG